MAHIKLQISMAHVTRCQSLYILSLVVYVPCVHVCVCVCVCVCVFVCMYVYMCINISMVCTMLQILISALVLFDGAKAWSGGNQRREHFRVVLPGHHQGRDDRVL